MSSTRNIIYKLKKEAHTRTTKIEYIQFIFFLEFNIMQLLKSNIYLKINAKKFLIYYLEDRKCLRAISIHINS